MLKTLIRTATERPARTEPSSLLKLVAGEFAARVALLWPDPHAEFLTAPAARRHLACLALALGRDGAVVREALDGRLRVAVRRIVRPAPAGLERALGRLGETAWTGDAYLRLLDLLADGAVAKLLWHAEAIEAPPVERLGLLPPPMRRAWRLVGQLSDDSARAVAEAYGAIALRTGPEAADAAAAGWAEAETLGALFEAVRDDIYPEPPEPPHPGTPILRPLATKAALRAAANRYANCLASRLNHAVGGWSAYYEWTPAPGAIVEVSRDPIFGWRLNEAKGPNNAVLDADVREDLAAELAVMGVSVGRNGWQLERALNPDVGRAWRLRPVAEDLAEVFGDD
jgi:hypothetical protein